MIVSRFGIAAMIVALAMGGTAMSADIAKLEWGEFTLLSDSSNKAGSWSADASNDGMTLTFLPKHVVAKADGPTPEARAHISGEFALFAPSTAAFDRLHVKVKGYIIKHTGTTAKLIIGVGGESHTFEWGKDDTQSGNFAKEADLTVKTGQLPNPFPVSAEAYASKDGTESGVFLSLESVEVGLTPGAPKVASAAQ
ncbi:MAG: hypothetical protein ACKVP5_12405 [Aestuariivirga sp.]